MEVHYFQLELVPFDRVHVTPISERLCQGVLAPGFNEFVIFSGNCLQQALVGEPEALVEFQPRRKHYVLHGGEHLGVSLVPGLDQLLFVTEFVREIV